MPGSRRWRSIISAALLKHAKALCAICSPTTNSYKRLVPGYEAPVNLAYSSRNRSAAIRIPTYSESPKAKRIEYRPPDPAANPYLCFAALLMAGLDGVLRTRSIPANRWTRTSTNCRRKNMQRCRRCPAALRRRCERLEKDHEFLLKGDVFTPDFLEMWISHKRKEARRDPRSRPHPYEFSSTTTCNFGGATITARMISSAPILFVPDTDKQLPALGGFC